MMTLIAAALAAQAAPAANMPPQHGQHMPAAQHEQHQGMKDCCKDCCKDMAKGEHDMHASPQQPKGGD
jgi:hypothetical protein